MTINGFWLEGCRTLHGKNYRAKFWFCGGYKLPLWPWSQCGWHMQGGRPGNFLSSNMMSLVLFSEFFSQPQPKKFATKPGGFQKACWSLCRLPSQDQKKVVADRFISNVGYFNYPKCCVYVGLVDRIFNIGQDWASVTSGNSRSLCLHAMTLASRSGGARWEHCCLEWLLPKC